MTSSPSADNPLSELDVFAGEISNAEARIYARLPAARSPTTTSNESYRFVGSITGPYCQYNRTLPATIPLVDRGPGDGLLAQAIVPDPCFWSPELPMLYRANVELQHVGRTVASAERWLGIKPLGIRGSRLIFDGRNLVLRAVRWQHVPSTPLSDWRELSAAVDIDEPDDTWLEEAGRVGVWVIARTERAGDELSAVVRRLARWPAVAVVAIGSAAAAPLHFAGNCILAQIASDELMRANAGCQAVLVNAGSAFPFAKVESRPVLVERGAPSDILADARRACDVLQAEMASRGQFAGYLV